MGQCPRQGQVETSMACLCTALGWWVGQEFMLPEASGTFINPVKSEAIPLGSQRPWPPQSGVCFCPLLGQGGGGAPRDAQVRGPGRAWGVLTARPSPDCVLPRPLSVPGGAGGWEAEPGGPSSSVPGPAGRCVMGLLTEPEACLRLQPGCGCSARHGDPRLRPRFLPHPSPSFDQLHLGCLLAPQLARPHVLVQGLRM